MTFFTVKSEIKQIVTENPILRGTINHVCMLQPITETLSLIYSIAHYTSTADLHLPD